jgi:DNA polymerase III delta subunit
VEAALLEERAQALGDLDPAWVLTELEPGPGFADGLAATAMLALGEDRRVVVVRRAGALDVASWEALLSYLAAPPEHVHVILEGQGWTSPSRSRALSDRVKAVGGRVRREDLPPPGKRIELVRALGEKRQVHLSPGAARYLAEFLGEELGNAGAYLDQLATLHGTGARIDEDDVARLFVGTRRGYQWDITDAIDRGDTRAALEYLHGAFDQMHPLALHAAFVTHYRRIVLVAGRRLDPGAAAATLGMKEYPAKKILEQAARLGSAGARRAYELLAEADVALRGGEGSLEPTAVLDVLVVRLCALTARSGQLRGG